MGFFSGGSTTSTSDSFSGLRGTKQFKPFVGEVAGGFTTGLNFAKNRLQNTNPFQLNISTGLTAPQTAAFNTLGQNLFSNVSSNFAGRGFLSPENVGGVIGSSLTQAAPQLLQQVFQNQVANESAIQDRFGALRGLLDTGTGLAGSETHSTSTTKGPNLLGGAIAQGIGSFTNLNSYANLLSAANSGGGGAACWIAEALFGVNDVRTHCARWYVNNILPQSFVGRIFRRLYLRYGQGIAKRIPTSSILRDLLTPLFTYFANSGARYVVSRVA